MIILVSLDDDQHLSTHRWLSSCCMLPLSPGSLRDGSVLSLLDLVQDQGMICFQAGFLAVKFPLVDVLADAAV